MSNRIFSILCMSAFVAAAGGVQAAGENCPMPQRANPAQKAANIVQPGSLAEPLEVNVKISTLFPTPEQVELGVAENDPFYQPN